MEESDEHVSINQLNEQYRNSLALPTSILVEDLDAQTQASSTTNFAAGAADQMTKKGEGKFFI